MINLIKKKETYHIIILNYYYVYRRKNRKIETNKNYMNKNKIFMMKIMKKLNNLVLFILFT